MSKCSECKYFYTCDNMGWFEECQSADYKNFEPIEEDENMTKLIDNTPYFTAYKEDDNFIRLVDINGNYTLLDKDELNELIALLKKCKETL